MSSANNHLPSPTTILPPYAGAGSTPLRRRFGLMVLPVVALCCLLFGLAFALFAPDVITPFSLPIVFLLLVMVWALPDSRGAPGRTLEVLFFAFSFMLVMWPNYLAIAIPGLPWITMDRLTGLPLTLALLIAVSTSPEFRSRSADALRAAPVLWRLLVGFVVIQALSIGLSKDPTASIQLFIVFQVGWTATFFAAVYIFLKPGRAERWAAMLWAMAILVGLIGLVEIRFEHVPWAHHIPGVLKVQDPVVAAILKGTAREASGQYRIQSTFTTPLTLAEFLALTLPFVIHFMMGEYGWRVRLAAIVSAPFFLFVILLTDSRLGMVGFLLSFLLYGLLWALIRWRRDRRSLIGPAVSLAYPAVFLTTFAATFVIGHLHALVWGNGPQAASNESRVEQLTKGLPLVFKHPWGNGVGMGAITLDLPDPVNGIPQIDNYYLLIGLEYGVVGFLVFYGMILTAIYYAATRALRTRAGDRDIQFILPVAVALANFFVIKSIFSQQDNHPLIFMMMGMIAALAFRIKREADEAGGAQALVQRGAPRSPRRPASQPLRP